MIFYKYMVKEFMISNKYKGGRMKIKLKELFTSPPSKILLFVI